MEPISVTKDDTAVLDREKMAEAAFGVLCEAFAEQIMERAGYHEGLYRQVALEFLREEEPANAPPAQNIFNIDLSLILKTIRSETAESQSRTATEKLLEHMIRIREKQGPRAERGARVSMAPPVSMQNVLEQTPPGAGRAAEKKTGAGRLAALSLRGIPGGFARPGSNAANTAFQNAPGMVKTARVHDAVQRRLPPLSVGPEGLRAQFPALLPALGGTARRPEGAALLKLKKEPTLPRGAGNPPAARATLSAAGELLLGKPDGAPASALTGAAPTRPAADSVAHKLEEPGAGEKERRGVSGAAERARGEKAAVAIPAKAGEVPGEDGLLAGAGKTALQARDIRSVSSPIKGDPTGKTAFGAAAEQTASAPAAPESRPGESASGMPPQELTYSETGSAPSPPDASGRMPHHQEAANRESDRAGSSPDDSRIPRQEPANRAAGRTALTPEASIRMPRREPANQPENQEDGRVSLPLDDSGRPPRQPAHSRTPDGEARTQEDAADRAEASPKGASVRTAQPMERASRDIRSALLPVKGDPTGKTALGAAAEQAGYGPVISGHRPEESASGIPPQELTYSETGPAPSPADASGRIPRREPADRESDRAGSSPDASGWAPRQEAAPSRTPTGEGRMPEDAGARAEASPKGASGLTAQPMERASRDIRSVSPPVKGDPTGKTALGAAVEQAGYGPAVPGPHPGESASGMPPQELTYSETGPAPSPADASGRIPRQGSAGRKADRSGSLPDASSRMPHREATSHEAGRTVSPPNASSHIQYREPANQEDGRASFPPDASSRPPRHEPAHRGTPPGEGRMPEDAGARAEASLKGASSRTAQPMERASRDIRSVSPPVKGDPTDKTALGAAEQAAYGPAVPGSRPGESASGMPPQELAYSETGPALSPADGSARIPRGEPADGRAGRISSPSGPGVPAGETFWKRETEQGSEEKGKDRPSPAVDRESQGAASPFAAAARGTLQASRDIRVTPLFPQKAEAAKLPQDTEPGAPSGAPARSAAEAAASSPVPEELVHPEFKAAAHPSAPAVPDQRTDGALKRDAISLKSSGAAPENAGDAPQKRMGRSAAPFPAGPRAMRDTPPNAEHGRTGVSAKSIGPRAARYSPLNTQAFVPGKFARRSAFAARAGGTVPPAGLPAFGEELLHRMQGSPAANEPHAATRPARSAKPESPSGIRPAANLLLPLTGAPRMNGLRPAAARPPLSQALRADAAQAEGKRPDLEPEAAALRDAQARKSGENAKSSPNLPLVELTYGRMAQDLWQDTSQPVRDPRLMDSEYVGSLPGWAQNFLKSGTAEQTALAPAEAMRPAAGSARDISVLARSVGTADQIDWSAPVPSSRPAEMDFYKKEEPKEIAARSAPLSEAEIRRTADKVYRMLEDRIRRERRRLGL